MDIQPPPTTSALLITAADLVSDNCLPIISYVYLICLMLASSIAELSLFKSCIFFLYEASHLLLWAAVAYLTFTLSYLCIKTFKMYLSLQLQQYYHIFVSMCRCGSETTCLQGPFKVHCFFALAEMKHL